MQKKCLQNPQQKPPTKTQQKPKNQNFIKWIFANPAHMPLKVNFNRVHCRWMSEQTSIAYLVEKTMGKNLLIHKKRIN